MDEVVLMKVWFSPVIVIPPMFHTHRHIQGKLAKPGNLEAKRLLSYREVLRRNVRVFVTWISSNHQRVGNVATPRRPVSSHKSFLVCYETVNNRMLSVV